MQLQKKLIYNSDPRYYDGWVTFENQSLEEPEDDPIQKIECWIEKNGDDVQVYYITCLDQDGFEVVDYDEDEIRDKIIEALTFNI